ncbi:hypothetical protein D9M68_831590 [compost metagenome]
MSYTAGLNGKHAPRNIGSSAAGDHFQAEAAVPAFESGYFAANEIQQRIPDQRAISEEPELSFTRPLGHGAMQGLENALFRPNQVRIGG